MSFKIVNAGGENKSLRSTAFVSGIAVGENISALVWAYGPTGTYKDFLKLYSGSDFASLLDTYLTIRTESNNVFHGTSKVYSGSTIDATDTGWPNNTWSALVQTSTLSGNVTIQRTGDTENTAGTLGAAWFSVPTCIELGSGDASQTYYIDQIAIYQGVLSGANISALLGGANPLAVDAANLIEYWDGTSLTGLNGTVLSENGTGTFTIDGVEVAPVDDPPGGASAVPLLMQMYHEG